MTRAVALVTCRSLPHLEDDDHPLVSALKELNCRCVVTLWDDTAVDWSQFDAVVLRSPIDYVQRLQEFLDWAGAIKRLHNPFPMVRWNTDKAYLRDLEGAGVSIVPTRWIPVGEALATAPDHHFVVKPSVGVGGEGVQRYGPEERARAAGQIRQLHEAGHPALIQPYLSSVEDRGEASLVYFDAKFSHAVRRPGFRGVGTKAEAGYSPTAAQSQLADRTVAHVTSRFGAPLFARIDLLETPGGPAVNEVEVTDPILHLLGEPSAAPRFAQAIVARLPEKGFNEVRAEA